MGKEEKRKILIVDDSEMNREILSDMLGNEYDVIEAEDGSKAVAILMKHGVSIDLVLLDIVMPVMDGYEVLTVMNEQRWIEDIPVIMISAENSQTHIERAYELGVSDFISRPFDALIVRRRVVNTIMLYTKQKKLAAMVADQIYDKQRQSNIMINILSHIVEFRNGESGLHILHVQVFTEILLKKLVTITDKYQLSNADINMISTASALHDIGKISIPDEILNKPGRLTPEEFEVIKTHSAAGAGMLEHLAFYRDEPLVKVAHDICRWHHERYDGRGYPDGLKGDAIPISAQIVALADVYDALTCDRVYKKAYTHERAIGMILNGECGTFNPILLKCLIDSADKVRNELEKKSIDYSNDTKERELQSLADELLAHDELAVSGRTLHLLEREQIKNEFFSSLSNRIQFEYTVNPSMVMFTGCGAGRLGLDSVTVNPSADKVLRSTISDEDFEKLVKCILGSTVENASGEFKCRLKFTDGEQDVRIVYRTLWSGDQSPFCIGIIGEIITDEN